MNLSKKIILASSVCAAFLAIGIGCSVEDRDLEGGIFKCLSDDDCLSGSQCVKAKQGENFYGECTRDEDIVRCRDNDGDTYIDVVLTKKDIENGRKDEEFFNECGFSNEHPRDPDDSDPMVYPGATESCDGKDNSGDGCIDGIKDANGNCVDLIQPCWGAGSYTDYENSACSPEIIGVNICREGRLVHALKKGDSFEVDEGGKCPETINELKAASAHLEANMQYADNDLKPGYDNNCDGIKDKKECKSTNDKCYVTKEFSRSVTSAAEEANLSKVVAKCTSEADCACVGTMVCVGDNLACTKGGAEITKESVKELPCGKAFDSEEEGN